MELRHLRYFVAVAEEENVTRAARRLNIRQPPLTQQIQALERELGVQLFQRSPRKIALNDAGRLFYQEALQVLHAADTAVREVRFHAQGGHGLTLRIGLTYSALLNPQTQALLQTFQQRHPLVKLHIEDGSTLDLLQGLQASTLDAAFVRTQASRLPELDVLNFAEDPVLVALHTSHPLAAATSVRLPQLREEAFIMPRQQSGFGLSLDLLTQFASEGFEPSIAHEPLRASAALGLVASGLGVTMVAGSLRHVQLGTVLYRPLVGDTPYAAPLNIVSLRQRKPPALALFLAAAGEGRPPPPGTPTARPLAPWTVPLQ